MKLLIGLLLDLVNALLFSHFVELALQNVYVLFIRKLQIRNKPSA